MDEGSFWIAEHMEVPGRGHVQRGHEHYGSFALLPHTLLSLTCHPSAPSVVAFLTQK